MSSTAAPLPFRTIIMAAGTSERLRPLTEHVPKTLLRLGEKTILEHILDTSYAVGLRHFDIVTGHGHKAVEQAAVEYRERHPDVHINLIYNDQYNNSGNVVSMLYAKEVFDEDFILINSDTIFHRDILERLVQSKHANAMVIDDYKTLSDEEMKVHIDDNQNITHIHKSLDPDKAYGEYIGVLKLSKGIKHQLVKSLDATIANDNSVYYEDALQHMITQHGVDIKPISTHGQPAMEIDTHEDLATAAELIHKLRL